MIDAELAFRAMLVERYPREEDQRRVASDAGLDQSLISFDSKAANSWHSILVDARHRNRTDALVDVVVREYDAPPLRDAATAYLKQLLDHAASVSGIEPLQVPQGSQASLTAGIDRPYASRIEDFLREYADAPFGGRQAETAALTSWLADPASATGLVLAEAGQGKSALLVHWLADVTTAGGVDVVYLPVSLRFDTAHIDCVARAMAGRLRSVQPSAQTTLQPLSPFVALDETRDQLRSDWVGAKPLLVVVDGLDEVIGWEPSRLLPQVPGQNVKILVAARGSPSNRERWTSELRWNAAAVFTVPPLGCAAVAELVAAALGPIEDCHDALLDRFYQLTEGDPLVVQLHLSHLTEMTDGTVAHRLETLVSNPSTADRPLTRFFERWWEEQRKQWGERQGPGRDTVHSILNLLACARGPLGLADLCALVGADGHAIRDGLAAIERFVISAQGGERYVLGHSRLHDYFADRLHEEDSYDGWRSKFLTYGKQRFAELESELPADRMTVQRRFGYVLAHYALHLEEHTPDELVTLMSERWLRAWKHLAGDDGMYGGFYEDVARAGRHARSKRAQAPLWRSLLIIASITSLSSNVPSSLLGGLVSAKLWPLARALKIADRCADDDDRVRALAALAGAVEEGEQLDIVAHAYALPPPARCRALRWMMDDLTGAARDVAFTHLLADGLVFRYYTVANLDELMRAVPTALARRLLAVATELRDPELRAHALVAIAAAGDVLPPAERQDLLDRCEQATAAVTRVDNRAHHRCRLAVAASKDPPDLRARLLRAAWSDLGRLDAADSGVHSLLARIADAIDRDDEIHDEVVAALWAAIDAPAAAPWQVVPVLGPRLGRLGFVRELLARIDSIKLHEHSLGTLLASLMPHAGPLKAQILERLGRFNRREFALEPLGYQYAHLTASQRATYMEELLPLVARGATSSSVIGKLATHLAPDDPAAPALLAAAKALVSPDRRADRLIECWELVPASERESLVHDVLASARQIDHREQKRRLLAKVARRVAGDPTLLRATLEVSRQLDDEHLLVHASMSLSERLCADGCEEDAVLLAKRTVAAFANHRIWSATTYLRVLRKLQPGDRKHELWRVAVATTARVGDDFDRALLMVKLIPEAPVADREGHVITTKDCVDRLEGAAERLYAEVQLLPYLSDDERQERLRRIAPALAIGTSVRQQFALLRALLPQLTPDMEAHREVLAPVLERVLGRTTGTDQHADDSEPFDHASYIEALAGHLDLATTRELVARWSPFMSSTLEPLAVRLAQLGQADEAMDTVRQLESPEHRAMAFARLLPHVSPDRRPAMIDEARRDLDTRRDRRHTAEAVSLVIDYLQEPERTERLTHALRDVLGERHGRHRHDTLRRLVDSALRHLPPAALDIAADELLAAIANQRRDELVQDLVALIPLTHRLGGRAALIAQGAALLDVAGWFAQATVLSRDSAGVIG